MKNCRNIIILVLLIVILLMSVAYSAFTTQLTVNGTAEIISEWNVKITGIRASFISEGCDAGDPQFTNSTVTFDAKLVKPGDHIILSDDVYGGTYRAINEVLKPNGILLLANENPLFYRGF